MRLTLVLPLVLALIVNNAKARSDRATVARVNTSRSESLADSALVQIKNGITALELPDGTKVQIVVGWRDNNNAHGHSSAEFYIVGKSDNALKSWEVVPFFGGPGNAVSGDDIFKTEEGADCTLRDLRVVRRGTASLQVIIGQRELGASYADPAGVQFDYYSLRRGNGDAGIPPFRFEHTRTVVAKRAYCDVNEAFRAELSLGSLGLGHAEGGR